MGAAAPEELANAWGMFPSRSQPRTLFMTNPTLSA